MREELSPTAHCFFQSGAAVPSVVIVLSRFQPFRAETVSISNTTYIAKRNILIQTKLTFFQNHFTASGSPVDSILPNFSLFGPFNRVNLWHFAIFFNFYFLTHTSCLNCYAWLVLNLCMAPIVLFSTKGSPSRWDVPDVSLFQGQTEPCRDSKLTMHSSSNMKYESKNKN